MSDPWPRGFRAKPSDPTVVDCFAGAGGLSLGLVGAGWRPILAFDHDPLACETYRRNLGGHVVHRDLGAVVANGVDLRPDLVAGGPPCQGFSTQRRGPAEDKRNDLVGAYFEFAVSLKPAVILMENVPGVLGERGKAGMAQVHRRLADHGYEFAAEVVQAADFGLPQRRRRAIVVAWDPSRSKPFAFSDLERSSPRTVRDAIADLPEPTLDFADHPTYPNHVRVRMSERNIERISHVPPGGGRLNIPEHLRLACHRDSAHRHLDVYGRLSWDEPAGTITAMFDNFTRGRFAHPDQDRNLTNREGARIQSFPDEFVFAGPKKDVARQIGNAVPPHLARVIGRQLRRMIRGDDARRGRV